MPSKDTYIAVAKQIREYLDSFGLGFKTWNVTELEKMLKAIAGEGARLTGEGVANELQQALLERGLLCYPKPSDAQDGYVRVFRTGTVAANLLQAFLYPGPSGDADLARLLKVLRARRADEAATDDEPE